MVIRNLEMEVGVNRYDTLDNLVTPLFRGERTCKSG